MESSRAESIRAFMRNFCSERTGDFYGQQGKICAGRHVAFSLRKWQSFSEKAAFRNKCTGSIFQHETSFRHPVPQERRRRETLSGALGHCSAGFTLNTYTHATAQMKQDAADTIGAVISRALQKHFAKKQHRAENPVRCCPVLSRSIPVWVAPESVKQMHLKSDESMGKPGKSIRIYRVLEPINTIDTALCAVSISEPPHMRRTSVFVKGKNLGAGRIHSARALQSPWGGGGRRPPEPKKEDTPKRVFLFGTSQHYRCRSKFTLCLYCEQSYSVWVLPL